MSRGRGFAFALGSVGLVSAAQLGMRWSMTRLPLPDEWLGAFSSNAIDLGALGVVSLAILAYALSMHPAGVQRAFFAFKNPGGGLGHPRCTGY